MGVEGPREGSNAEIQIVQMGAEQGEDVGQPLQTAPISQKTVTRAKVSVRQFWRQFESHVRHSI
jgi:hypothetical protein